MNILYRIDLTANLRYFVGGRIARVAGTKH
jgi:hypothetical protein